MHQGPEPGTRHVSLRAVLRGAASCYAGPAMPNDPDITAQDALPAHEAGLVDAVADWLMDQALGDSDMLRIFDGCCERLRAAGIPLWRTHIAYHTIHPLFEGMGATWIRGTGAEAETYVHRDVARDGWRQSPLYYMVDKMIPHLRRRLTGDDALLDFPLLEELRDKGATDYLAFILPFGESKVTGVAGSWTSDRPGGFSDQDIQALIRIGQRLGVALKVTIKDQIAHNVAAAYLGRSAGARVLEGVIQRGAGETTHAVIWYSDLRGSTAMADNMPADDYLAVLNSYFEITAGAVLDAGGDVLDFIGDAVLGIFPIGDGVNAEAQACETALTAAANAGRHLAMRNAERAGKHEAPLAYGLALHVGRVMYGNIGVPERLAFSVIGPAVNEVVRLEALTKTLDRTLLVSEAFARPLDRSWESLGKHALRGVGARMEVLAPSDP